MTTPAPSPGPAIADMAMKAIMGLSAGYLAEAQVNASNKINEANAFASNLVRSANNQLSTARGSLARYTQSVNNQRVLENTGKAAEAAAINYRRARDSATSDDFESQIAFAEQAGAQAAASALSGLTGGVADIVNGTTALRKARLQSRQQTALKQSDYDAGRQQSEILQSGWDSVDYSDITDSIDFSKDVATRQAYGGNLFTEAMANQDLKSMANFFSPKPFNAFADRAGAIGSGSVTSVNGGNVQRTITGGR